MSNQAVGLWASEVGPMRVGELAKLSKHPYRSLRYYEEQGIIKSRRLDNAYRTYDDYNVNRVVQIRGLLVTNRTECLARNRDAIARPLNAQSQPLCLPRDRQVGPPRQGGRRRRAVAHLCQSTPTRSRRLPGVDWRHG